MPGIGSCIREMKVKLKFEKSKRLLLINIRILRKHSGCIGSDGARRPAPVI